MGFFSARRSEDISEQLEQDPTVVRVIRSRFYGKQATGKARNAGTDPHPSHSNRSHQPPTHYDSETQRPTTNMPSSSKLDYSPTTPRVQPSADSITITLAQRLDELAVANSEGLLNDDEYRLLRQSLFDRLAAGSTIPTEMPLVPVAVGGRENGTGSRIPTSPLHQRRPSSHYNASNKSPSIQSKRSLSSAVSSILRRATSKRKSSDPVDDSRGDTTSLFSFNSATTAFPRLLSKQPSTVSLRTEVSLTDGYSSRLNRADYGSRSHSLPASPSISRSTTRSQRAAPPSSFSGKGVSREPRHVHPNSSDGFADDEQLQSAHDIRQELEAIEAEARRLLDAFNGLELSTLVRHQKHGTYGARTPLPSSSSNDLEGRFRAGSVSMSPKGSPARLGRDGDAASIRSSQSIQTMFSTNKAPSLYSKAQRPHAGTIPTLSSGSLLRKNSVSSMSVHSKKSGNFVSPISPSIPRTPSRYRLGSTSSVNLSRSANHLPLETVSEAETHQRPHSPTWSGTGSAGASMMRIEAEGTQAEASADEEMADIRRRRAEVTARYDARLEYLRARLRGAELREKLMRS